MKDLASELAALRGPAPFPVDVADRVMARIAAIPPPSAAVPTRSWRWIATAAGLAGAASLSGLVASWPAARAAIGGALVEAAGLARAVGGSSTTVASASRGVSRTIELAGSTAAALANATEPLRPLATVTSFTLAAITATAMIVIVVRDLSRAPALEER